MLAPATREFTTLEEALERECADRLQRTEATVPLDVLGPPYELFVDETPQQIQRLYTITPGLDAHPAPPTKSLATVMTHAVGLAEEQRGVVHAVAEPLAAPGLPSRSWCHDQAKTQACFPPRAPPYRPTQRQTPPH